MDGGMLGFECATFTTHVCMRARVILVEAQKLETSKGRRAQRRMKSEKKRILKNQKFLHVAGISFNGKIPKKTLLNTFMIPLFFSFFQSTFEEQEHRKGGYFLILVTNLGDL